MHMCMYMHMHMHCIWELRMHMRAPARDSSGEASERAGTWWRQDGRERVTLL